MKEQYEVTFHFNTGKTLTMPCDKEALIKLQESLKRNWDTCCIVGDEWGLTLSAVTHYIVK